MNHTQPLMPVLLPLALCGLLAACGGEAAAPPPAAAPPAATQATAAPAAFDTRVAAATPATHDETALVDEIASTLQACSYDGAPVRIGGSGVRAQAPGGCPELVERIMRFTGLPQNFDVVEAPVPNAAAVILLDKQKIPRRVIAFNRDFLALVDRATGHNEWAPVSIMAHEIGHHLSGHTITPGGSQPPTELEADKFSGFVLYKMGATLPDAQKAMATLVAEGPDGKTHPGRGKRLAAIEEGWQQACRQQGGGQCRGALEVAARTTPDASGTPEATPAAPREPAPPTVAAAPSAPAAAPSRGPGTLAPPPANAPAPAPEGRDVLPTPGSTPAKFNQFVYDEFNLLDREQRAAAEKRMYEVARDSGVEVVTLLVRDLHGMQAQDYAYAMLRQLRVGKLDVGNGAVVVVAPEQKQYAIAIGPGLLIEVGNLQELNLDSLRTFVDSAWPVCTQYGNCKGWTENFFLTSDRIARSGKHWEWMIRFASLAEMKATEQRETQARDASGESYDPDKSSTWRKIGRLEATVVSLKPDPQDRKRFVNEVHAGMVGPAMLVRSADGVESMLYVHPHVQALMPAGPLVEGKRYAFVFREASLSLDVAQLDLLSYDALP